LILSLSYVIRSKRMSYQLSKAACN